MKIAVVGCSHGKLDTIYAEVERQNRQFAFQKEEPIRLLLCCGDFEMDCPPKFRVLGDFHNYYSGLKRAPVLTLVIGGNHEAQNYLKECYHGAWLAPSIYFLGYAGCVVIDDWLTLAGSSGIHDRRDLKKGHYEEMPLQNPQDIKTAFHTRHYDIFRILQLKDAGIKPDIYMSHDWPCHIEMHGDTAALLRAKPGFQGQVGRDDFGSAPLERVLKELKPKRWVSGHHHTRFTAQYVHSNEMGEATEFLALSKPGLKDSQYFEVLNVEGTSKPPSEINITAEPTLSFHPDWLAIVRATNIYFPTSRAEWIPPARNEFINRVQEAKRWVTANIDEKGKLDIGKVQRFSITAPATVTVQGQMRKGTSEEIRAYVNSQTIAFCTFLGIKDVVNAQQV